MAAVDYERAALKMLGLPHPSDENLMNFHHIGETEVCDCPDACRDVVARRLERVRRVVSALHDTSLFTAAQRARVETENFLTYGEYIDAVRRIVSIRERVQRIGNAERRRDFDRQHRDNATFHADHLSPSPLEEHLSRIHDPDRLTPDWPGYVAYLAKVAPSLREFFYRRLPVLIPEDARKRHTYVTGQSGSGILKVLFNAYSAPTPR